MMSLTFMRGVSEPYGSWETLCNRRGVGGGRLVGRAVLVQAVHLQGLADDVLALHARVQRAIRVLVDHLHAAAELLGLRARETGHVLAFEQDAAAGAVQH